MPKPMREMIEARVEEDDFIITDEDEINDAMEEELWIMEVAKNPDSVVYVMKLS